MSKLAQPRSKTILALTGLLASACVHYTPRPIEGSTTLASIEARTLVSPELEERVRARSRTKGWPPASWDLNALTLAAFHYHSDLEEARASWAVSRAAAITAGERPNPGLILAPGYNSTTPVNVVTPWIWTLGLDFTIETAGKRGYRIAQAQEQSEAARLHVASVAWQVRSRLRQRLLTLFAASSIQTVLTRREDLQAVVVSLLERQLSAGAISPFEMTQARVALTGAQLARLDARRQEAEARVSVAAAIGITSQALDGVALSFDAFDPLPPNLPEPEVRHQALLNRPDVLGALMDYAASQSALQLAIARQYPDVHLGPGYQMDQTDNKWTLALGGLLPVFHRNRGAIAEAEARRTEAAARFTGVQSRAIEEIDRANVAYHSTRDKADAIDGLVAHLRDQLRSAETRFNAGDISRLELATAQLELTMAELARLDALVRMHEAFGLLEDAMQSPADLAAWLPTDPA